MKGLRFLKGAMFALVAAAFVALVVFALMYCWNYAMPAVFGLPMISFWQALALFIVSKILFWGGFGRGRHWRPSPQAREAWAMRMQNKMHNLTPEEKERMRKYWEHKCGRRFGGGWNQQTETPETRESQV